MKCGYNIILDLEKDRISYSCSDDATKISFSGSHRSVDFKPEDCTPSFCGLELNISQACNMRCTYCFAGQGRYDNEGLMSIDVAKKSVDLFKQISSSDSLSIGFFGGEPLLNFGMMKDLVGYLGQNLIDKKLDLKVSTNGTIINEEMLEFFKKHHIRIQVSVDGNKENHDRFRRFRDNSPSYDSIVKNLMIMKDAGLRPRVLATLCHKNTDARSIIQYFSNELDIKTTLSPVMSNNVDIVLDDDDFALIFKSYIDLYQDVMVTKNYKEIFCNSILSSMILHCFDMNGSSMSMPKSFFCGAGIRMILVDTSGNIYPCHGLVGQDQFKIGNVYDSLDAGKLKQFLEKIHLANKGQCFDCFARNVCGGGCSLCFQITNGDVSQPQKEFCEFVRTMYKLAIIFYVFMKDHDLPADMIQKPALAELNDILLDR